MFPPSNRTCRRYLAASRQKAGLEVIRQDLSRIWQLIAATTIHRDHDAKDRQCGRAGPG